MKRYAVTYNTDKESSCYFTCMADSRDDAWKLFCSEVRSEVETYLESIHESYDDPTLGRVLISFKEQRVMIRSYSDDEVRYGSEWLKDLEQDLLSDRMFILRDESSDEYDLCITLC